jgi:cell filamentation protein, protein adenylyltransferase
LIVSNDTIMKPPYDITNTILELIASISIKIGEVNANYLHKTSPQLRKQNKVKTIHSSLQIEGNTLTEEQITALIENKRIVGPKKDITEVINAIAVYNNVLQYNPFSEKSFLNAHKTLMKGLIKNPGKYRTQSVGIMRGKALAHLAPPYENLPYLMKDLFEYIKKDDDLILIKSCVFHYEMEFIHPFIDGNGRMGRLWQALILMKEYPVFEYLPFETMIGNNQKQYYKSLGDSDKTGKSTKFIEFMLTQINNALIELLRMGSKPLSMMDRIEYYKNFGKKMFSRKDYMNLFKHISSATASRDLKKGIELKIFDKTGEKNKTKYVVK